MNLRDFIKPLKVLKEGGNLSSQTPGWQGVPGDHQAQELDLHVHNRAYVQDVVSQTLHAINDAFTQQHKEPLWHENSVETQKFLSGSTFQFMDKNISDEEFVRVKPKVGDIDTQASDKHEETIKNFLGANVGKLIGNAVLLGFSPGNSQYTSLWEIKLKDLPVKIQIDFEYGAHEAETGLPTEWQSYSHSSSWDDLSQNIKGVFHKYLDRALPYAQASTKYVARVLKKSTKISPAPVTDSDYSFAVSGPGGGGVSQKYVPYNDPATGQPMVKDGIPVMQLLEPSARQYIQNLSQQFEIFFGRKPKGNDQELKNSFVGTVQLIAKYLDEQKKEEIAQRFFSICFEPGSQMITKDDPARDRDIKFSAIDWMLENMKLANAAALRKQAIEMAASYAAAFQNKAAKPLKEEAQVKAQLRKGMPHLHDLKPADLLDLLDEIHDGNGNFKLQNIPLNVKVDGFGGRFGKNSEGKPFMGTSRTEPRYEPGFVAYHQQKGTTDPDVLGRAQLFDNLFEEMMKAVQMVDSKLGPKFLINKQVTCEVLYLPFATETPEGKLKFVGIHYDKLPEGVNLALVPFRVTDATTGDDLPNSNEIVKELTSVGKSGSVMFIDNSLTQSEGLDVTALVPPLENIEQMKAMLASRKRDQAAEVKAALAPVATALEQAIIKDPNIIGKDLLGQDYEGIVINSRLGPIKVTSQEQRDVITAKNAAKVSARTERPRGEAKTAVVAVGSFIGHKGHEELFDYTIKKAKEVGGDPYLFIGNAESKDDPIPPSVKVETWHKLYPEYASNISTVQEGGQLIQKIKHELINPLPGKPPRYDNVIIMVGEDRAGMNMPNALMKAVNKFSGYEHVKVSLEVTPRGTGISGTALRNSLKNDPPEKSLAIWSNAFDVNKLGVDWIKHLMDITRKGMGIQQQTAPVPQTPGPQEINEDVGGNYLYHATGGLKKILSTGRIFPAHGPQDATKAQTTSTTVSTTRDWNYASGGESETQGVDSNAVIVLDRNAVESNFKTLGTSQSRDVRGLAYPQQQNLDAVKTARSYDVDNNKVLNKKDADELFAKGSILGFDGKPVSREIVGRKAGAAKQGFYSPKAGGEFEEAVVVPVTGLPIARTMVGFWVNPKSQLTKDLEVMNDPRRLELAPGGTGRFVKANKPSVQQPAPVAEQRLFNALIKPLNEGTSIDSTLRAVINDIGEPITSVYDTMKFQAKKYMENHGELGRGFRMVAAGVGGRWVQNMYIGRLHNELHDLCKYNTRRTVELRDFLRGEESDGEIEMKRSFGNLANNLPPILAKLGEQINAPQLTRNARRWMQNKAEYERYLMDLEASGDEPDDEPMIKPPKSNVVGQQNAQVDQIVNDILSKIPRHIAGEIRNAIARAPNKLAALKQELDRHHVKMAEDTNAMAHMAKDLTGHGSPIAKAAAQRDKKREQQSTQSHGRAEGPKWDLPEDYDSSMLRNGFSTEQEINGILYKAVGKSFKGSYGGTLTITAYDKNKKIGIAQFTDHFEKSGLESLNTDVDPAYQRQGIASTMYAYARMLGNTVHPSIVQTKQGEKMWKGWKKSGDAKFLKKEGVEETNHWYDAGVKDATRGARPNPRTYLPTLKDKQAKHPEEVYFYMNGYKSVKQGVAEAEKKPHPETWHDVDKKLGKAVDKMSQAEKVKKGLAHPDTLKKQGVAEGSENNNPIANKIFFARSNKAPKGWSYDHIGFITQDGKQIQMSGHKGNDVYVTNAVTDDPEFPKQNIKIVSLSKPVSVPTTNSVGAENCGTFVANVLQANGIKGIDTQKIYSVFKKPHEQGVAEAHPNQQAARYNPDGTTYRGSYNKMPTLDPNDPVHHADRYGPEHDEPYEMDVDKEDLKRAIAKGMLSLSDKAKHILKLRFWDNMTYEEIASEMGVSRERIRQIEAKALRQLKHPTRSDRLLPFVQHKGYQQDVAEVRMSAAQRLWNAEQKQRAKSDASLARTPSSIPKPEPKKDEKTVPVSEDVEHIMAALINKIIFNEAISNNKR